MLRLNFVYLKILENMHRYNYFRVQKIPEYEVWEIFFRKFSRKILEKFGGKLFYQRDQHPEGVTRRPPGTRIGCLMRLDSLASWDPLTCPPGGVRWGASAHLLPLDRKPPPGIFPKFSCARSSWYPSISKIRADFSNLFGGITPWYVTPPLIQLVLFLCFAYEVFCYTRCH